MKCALCRKESDLEESHVIPKFVYRSLKKHSPTGNMRMITEPNRKVQDGDKLYLLCGSCEDLFNNDETLFANNVYHKFQLGKLKEFEYGLWLERFIVSVNWRTLYLDIIEFVKKPNINARELEHLINCENILRTFLLNEDEKLGEIENHIFFFNEIQSASKEIANLNLHSAIGSSVGGYTVVFDDSSYIILNLQGLILVTILRKSKDECWEKTRVETSGMFNLQEAQYIRSPIISEFEYMATSINGSQKQLSDIQREKILDDLKKSPEKYIKSNAFIRLQNDKTLRDKYINDAE